MRTALIVGRFQPLHLGHLSLISNAAKAKDVKRLKIVIGSSQFARTSSNPFSCEERKLMLKTCLSKRVEKPFELFEVPDVEDDRLWVRLVERIAGEFDVVYTNGELERKLFEGAGYEVRSTPMYKRDTCSGTEIRRRMLASEEWEPFVPEEIRPLLKDLVTRVLFSQ